MATMATMATILYRIYLGGNNDEGGEPFPYSAVKAEVGRFFTAFTVYEATGIWADQAEGSWIIEVVGFPAHGGVVDDLAGHLCRVFRQKEILVTEIPLLQRSVQDAAP